MKVDPIELSVAMSTLWIKTWNKYVSDIVAVVEWLTRDTYYRMIREWECTPWVWAMLKVAFMQYWIDHSKVFITK